MWSLTLIAVALTQKVEHETVIIYLFHISILVQTRKCKKYCKKYQEEGTDLNIFVGVLYQSFIKKIKYGIVCLCWLSLGMFY
jgi:hypothetical protein